MVRSCDTPSHPSPIIRILAQPRRANHLHIFSVARTELARRKVGGGLFESDGNRISDVPSSGRHCYVHCGPAVWKRFSISKRQRRRGDLIIITATSIQILTDTGTPAWRRSGSILTRRANHRHIIIIARILEPAPGNRPRAFCIGRQPHVSEPVIPPMPVVVSGRVKASCRPNHQNWHDLFGNSFAGAKPHPNRAQDNFAVSLLGAAAFRALSQARTAAPRSTKMGNIASPRRYDVLLESTLSYPATC
jgi:hypothetical protein